MLTEQSNKPLHDLAGNIVGPRELRHFALILALLIAGIFGLLIPWWREQTVWITPLLIALSVVVLSWISPKATGWIYRGWMRFGIVMGTIVNYVILGALFYLMIMPVGIFQRLIGRDILQRKWNPDCDSYRTPSTVRTPDHMKRPF